jgi:Glycosyl-4,4'-diaponeurosporenoate acyltransferase
MSRTPQAEQGIRAMRSLLMIVILTSGSVYSIARHAPPHGNPLVYCIAASWLISITIAVVSSAIFFRVNPTRFSLAHWEKQGEIYDRAGIRAFRWVLFHSPLGWINGNFQLRAGRADCDRLLREMNSSEAVHWLTFAVSVMLAISYLVHGYVVYGYVMPLVRIPFDLYPIMLQRWNRGRVWRVLSRPAHTRRPEQVTRSEYLHSPVIMERRP